MSETKTMVLKVDLGCDRCYRKVKKLLCKIHGIVEQAFDEKKNEVTIKVKSSCLERIKSKLNCKGGKSIRSIEIKGNEKPKPETEDTAKTKDNGKPKGGEEKNDVGKQKAEEKAEEATEGKPPCNIESAWGYPRCPGWPCGGRCNRGCATPIGQPPYYHGYMKLLSSNDGCTDSGRCCCNTGSPAGCCPRRSSDCCSINRCSGCRCDFFTEESSACKLM